jgi:hypothetical protein
MLRQAAGCRLLLLLLLQAHRCSSVLARAERLTPQLTVESMFQPPACSMALRAGTVQTNTRHMQL